MIRNANIGADSLNRNAARGAAPSVRSSVDHTANIGADLVGATVAQNANIGATIQQDHIESSTLLFYSPVGVHASDYSSRLRTMIFNREQEHIETAGSNDS